LFGECDMLHTFLPENVDDMITAVLTREEIELERVGARRGGAYRILENGQLVGHVSVIANPNGDGWQLNESLPANDNLSPKTAGADTFTRATKAIWAGLNSAAEWATTVAERTAVYAADFGIVDAAVLDYLRQGNHWQGDYPIEYERRLLTDGAFAEYWLCSSKPGAAGHIGIIKLRALPAGVALVWGDPFVPERQETPEEWRAMFEAQQAAIARHRPADFDADDPAQYAALDAAVTSDRKYRMAKNNVMLQIAQEQQETIEQYEEQRQAIAEGVTAWLYAQGIHAATGPGAIAQPEAAVTQEATAGGNGQGEAAGVTPAKQGPRYYSNEEKIAAYKEWKALDRYITPIMLEEWLEEKFGIEYGQLKVKKSTFYGWKKLVESS
jgi:hypothetical protein